MRIVDRVEQVRAGEHERLRQAIFRLDSVLRALAEEEEQEFERANVVRYDIWGERRESTQTPTTPKKKVVQPLQLSWSPLEEALLARLDRWEEHLLPLCQRWLNGEGVEDDVREHAIALMDGRTRIEGVLREFRNQVLFFEALRDHARVLVAAIEASDRAEENELIPALLAGIPEVSAPTTPKSIGSDEVARNLRAAVVSRPPPPEEPPPRKGLSRWLPWGK